MSIRLGVPKEIESGERRVALVPAIADRFAKLGIEILIQRGAGDSSHYPDDAFKNVTFVDDAAALYQQADLILKVQPPSEAEIEQMKENTVVVSMMQPHLYPERVAKMRDHKILAFAMELVPRISRAQSMDVLSSQAAVAGYKAALMAADRASGFFPMLTTAAGTIRPAKVLVIGAGVAGLQAIATTKRLGAMVEGYDVRGATREQVESLGAKFVDTGVSAEGSGGYARELTDEEKAKQQEVLEKHIAAADAVIIALAAEGGGNCELTEPGKPVEHNGVVVYGPLNVPSELPVHASEMYSRNLLNFLTPMIEDGEFKPDFDDEVIADSTLTREGEIKHAPSRELVEGASS